MIEQREESNPRKYKVHKIIPNLPEIETSTIRVIDEAFFNIYRYKDFGKNYIKALHQINSFLYLFRYDSVGIKKLGYNIVDKTYIKKSKYFWLSYNNKFKGYSKYLNEEHRLWINPVDSNITSNESFSELYEKAMIVSAKILSSIEEKIRDGSSIDEFEEIIPDVSAVHGQKCNQNLELKYIKK